MIDLEKILAGDVMSKEELDLYARTRLLGKVGKKQLTPEMIKEIIQYNGLLPHQVKEQESLTDNHKLIQENGREQLYFRDGTLFIPQYSGNFRRRRYEDMITAWLHKCMKGKEIEFISREVKNDAMNTYNAYSKNLSDFMNQVFLSEMVNVEHTIFGSTESVKKVVSENSNMEMLREVTNQYLNFQILRIDGKEVLSIDYVYGDQAGAIVNNITKRYSAIAENIQMEFRHTFYLFGKVGGLITGKGEEDSMKRGDLIMPTSIVDYSDLVNQNITSDTHPLNNILADKVFVTMNHIYSGGPTVNVESVVTERREVLSRAAGMGALCIDLEIWEVEDAINRASRRFNNNLSELNFGFVGYVSDLPLAGDTLAREMKIREPEYQAIRIITNHILKNNK